MDNKTYRQRLLADIDGGVGERLVEDPLLDFIEGQMVKVGSLTHAQIKWQEVEQSALAILEKKSKDLKVFTYLLQCLLHKTDADRLLLSLQLLTDFIQHYWQRCYPAPGERGNLPRRKYFSQIMQRLQVALEKYDSNQLDSEQIAWFDETFAALKQAAQEQKLPVELIDTLSSLLRRAAPTAPSSNMATPVTASTMKSEEMRQTTPAATATLPAIDSSSERATRQTLLKIADYLTELEQGRALALRLRRFAVWLLITSLPEADAQQETALMPVPADLVADYEERLNRGADLALLNQVETSISLAPYWLDGHYLSFRITQKLERPDWSHAILNQTQLFITRLPNVINLSFKGGIPFASSATKTWLTQGEQRLVSKQAQTGQGWDALRQQAETLAKEGGLAVALTMLNEGLLKAHELRDQFYWRLLSADIMEQHKLGAMAQQEYQTLLTQLSSLSVVEWEPSLIQHIKHAVNTD